MFASRSILWTIIVDSLQPCNGIAFLTVQTMVTVKTCATLFSLKEKIECPKDNFSQLSNLL